MLTPPIRNLLIDRLETATSAGELKLDTEQYADVLLALFAEDYNVSPLPLPTNRRSPARREHLNNGEGTASNDLSPWGSGCKSGPSSSNRGEGDA